MKYFILLLIFIFAHNDQYLAKNEIHTEMYISLKDIKTLNKQNLITKKDIIDFFGSPMIFVSLKNKNDTWIYYAIDIPFNNKTFVRTVVISFNKNNIVKNINYFI